MTVSELRKEIFKEKRNDFNGIDADRLILLKDDADPGNKIIAENIKNQQELLPVRKIESYFKDEDNIFLTKNPIV